MRQSLQSLVKLGIGALALGAGSRRIPPQAGYGPNPDPRLTVFHFQSDPSLSPVKRTGRVPPRHANGALIPSTSHLGPFRGARPEILSRGAMPMNTHEKFLPSEMMTCTPAAHARSSWRGLLARLAAWVKSCADHYAAAAAYEELSRLSDAELKHRGLSRDILARDL